MHLKDPRLREDKKTPMEVTYTIEGIILNRQDWREVDTRLVIYTREAGKLDLVARGTKKLSSKLAGHLEPYNRTKIMVINGRSLTYVGAAKTLDHHYHLKQDLDKLEAVAIWTREFNLRVKHNQADAKLYSMLAHSLKVFNAIRADAIYYRALANLYILKLHALLGEGLDWDLIDRKRINPVERNNLQQVRIIINELYQGPPKLTKPQASLINRLVLSLRD